MAAITVLSSRCMPFDFQKKPFVSIQEIIAEESVRGTNYTSLPATSQGQEHPQLNHVIFYYPWKAAENSEVTEPIEQMSEADAWRRSCSKQYNSEAHRNHTCSHFMSYEESIANRHTK